MDVGRGVWRIAPLGIKEGRYLFVRLLSVLFQHIFQFPPQRENGEMVKQCHTFFKDFQLLSKNFYMFAMTVILICDTCIRDEAFDLGVGSFSCLTGKAQDKRREIESGNFYTCFS